MQDSAFVVWQNISGSGILTALYVCALIFLFFHEKENYKRILLIYLPLFWIAILLLPFTYHLVAEIIDEELYYRFFWMLPMTLVIAYTLVQLYHLYQGRYKKLVAVVLAAVIMVSGDFVYNNWRYSKAENIYHVPECVVQICDLMHIEGREVMALFPMELMQYVKQYDSGVCMPYGRNVLVADWNIEHSLYELMEAEVVDATALGEQALECACVYIVMHKDREMSGTLEDSGYGLITTIQEYRVYYNEAGFSAIY